MRWCSLLIPAAVTWKLSDIWIQTDNVGNGRLTTLHNNRIRRQFQPDLACRDILQAPFLSRMFWSGEGSLRMELSAFSLYSLCVDRPPAVT